MKLKKLRIRGFRNIADTTLDSDAKFVVVRGANRNGKTSIAEALSLALTPTTWGLTAKGDGYARKIKRDETKAVIEADLQGTSRTIRRTVTLGFTGRVQSAEDIDDPNRNAIKFEKLLEDKKTALGIAINTRAFQSMIYSGDEKAQKNLLAQLVLPARHEFPKETVAEVDGLIGEGTINFQGEPFAVIEQAYKRLFNERQDVNRKVKEFIIPDALPRPQGVDSETLKEQLAVLREHRMHRSAERDAASQKAVEETLKKERLEAKIETLKAVLKTSKEALQALQADILPNPSEIQETAGKKAERDRLVFRQLELSTEDESLVSERDRLLKIATVGAECPTCGQDIDEPKIIKLIEQGDARKAKLAEEYEKNKIVLESIGDADGAVTKLEKHKKAVAGQDELVGKVLSDTTALDYAKDEANAGYGGLFDPSTFDAALSKIEIDIEAILKQIQPVIAAEEKDKEIATKKEYLKRLEDKAEKLDTLVKFFDKDGIKAELIAQYIGGFENKVNEVLRGWDYKCSLSIEPFKFEITDHRNVSTPLIDLSGAEELMFYAAFQCAVSRTAGIGFVVIDRVDTLLPDLRPALYKRLYSMVDEGVLEQAILLVADTSDKVSNLPDSRFFVIEEGNIRRLG